MDMKELFNKLLYAQSENEVTNIINEKELLQRSVWKPYGGTDGNYSSFENQQSTAEGALIEKITNSIDAILTKQCLKKGIDPESKEAPQTMNEAINTLFSEGEMLEQDIVVVTDGEKNEPNIIIMDNGEGQIPDDFENTLLSLQRGNKNKIKFVQGKFNMGSTGAAVFCGKHKYQLIASKRHSSLSEDNRIGFTIVRKHVRNELEKINTKNTWYEYLTINGEIPQFIYEKPIIINELEKTTVFKDGTIIKLFNYNLEKKSVSYKHLRNVINSLLYYPAIPIKVLEVRNYERTNVANIAYGNGNILKGKANKSVSEKLEYESKNNILKDSYFGDIIISIYVFEENHKETAREYRGNMPIVFLMNGQVQYHEKTSFISNKLGLKLIKDHLIVAIDCTNLNQEFLDEGLFMANRETIRKTPATDRFIELITTYLKNNEDLKNINKKRASQKVTSQGTQQLISRLLGNDKQSFLQKMFTSKNLGTNPNYNKHLREQSDSKKNEKGNEVSIKEFPSFFNLTNYKKDAEGNLIKVLPVNKTGKLVFNTDAIDNYFSRSEKNGKIDVRVLELKNINSADNTNNNSKSKSNSNNKRSKISNDAFSIGFSDLKNGELKITLTPNDQVVNVGNEYEVRIEIFDENSLFENIVKLVIEEPASSNARKGKKQQPMGIELPSLVQVFKDKAVIDNLSKDDEEKKEYKTWEEYGWDLKVGAEKIVEIKPGIDENQVVSEIAINMSSPVLEQIIFEEGTTGTRVELAQEHFLTTLYMNSLLITMALDHITKDNEEIGRNIEEIEVLCTEIIKRIAYASVKTQLNAIKLHAN